MMVNIFITLPTTDPGGSRPKRALQPRATIRYVTGGVSVIDVIVQAQNMRKSKGLQELRLLQVLLNVALAVRGTLDRK